VSTFRTIYADPPWPERGGGKSKRGADRHYPLMTVRQIKALPVQKLADPTGCHLWLWATGNYLGDAVDVLRAWGFRLVNCRPWAKAEPHLDTVLPQAPGLGQYMRCDAEFLLFGVMGRHMRGVWKPRQTIYAPRNRHSVKPPTVRTQIEHMSPAPRVELFARQAYPGWDSWGNEVESTVTL
jgi:N6-adenosine-specific RNA methylase IME4